MRASATPVSTSRMDGGIFNRAAATATAAITPRRKTKVWIVEIIIAPVGGGDRPAPAR